MDGIELIEPVVQLSHPRLAVQFIRHRPLRKRGDVQPCPSSAIVEFVWEADVSPGHTQRLHT